MSNSTEKLAQEINDNKVNVDKKTFIKTDKEKELLKKMKASYKKKTIK
jgi:hypothetical protein